MPHTSSSSSTTNTSSFTTPFITFIPAGVAPIIDPSDPDIAHRAASDPHYPAFEDAMSVREEVFVREQGVPLENELDEDDHRSFHWVVYASVASTSHSSSISHKQNQPHYLGGGGPGTGTGGGGGGSSGGGTLTSRIPVGTIRLVPPPHVPHNIHHQFHDEGRHHHHPDSPPPYPPVAPPQAATHPRDDTAAGGGNYIKLGRLATLPAFRGLGIGKLLVETALTWAAEHPDEVMGETKPTLSTITGTSTVKRGSVSQITPGMLRAREGSPGASGASTSAVAPLGAVGGSGVSAVVGQILGTGKGWDGRVLVHAQRQVKGMWERLGFKVDEDLGEWDEEGIVHVGMWKQLQLKKHT